MADSKLNTINSIRTVKAKRDWLIL